MHLFEDYDIPKLLYYHINLYRPKGQSLKWKVAKMFKLIYRIIVKNFTLCGEYNTNPILYADRFISRRKDIEVMIDNLVQTFDGKCDRLKWGKKRSISLKRIVENTFFCLGMRDLLKKYSFFEYIYALILFLEMRDVEDELNAKVDIGKYCLCFCFYDAEPFQNFLIQYAKLHGCKTATLQHGIMLAPREGVGNNLDFAGHEFQAFVSDFFLVWNQFTKKEAMKTGIQEEQLKVLGVAKCVGMSQPQLPSDSSSIGVILDGKFEDENNIPMIMIVQTWAKKKKMKCVFRYHPDYYGNEFSNYINASSTVCPKGVSLYDFIRSVSFCVVANSTVLFELEYFCIPFLRYSSNGSLDKFRDYPSLNFTSIRSFDSAYKEMIAQPLRSFVKADANYAEFFKQFID